MIICGIAWQPLTLRALSAGCRGARGACGLHLDAGRARTGHPGAALHWCTRIEPEPSAQHMLGTALSNQRVPDAITSPCRTRRTCWSRWSQTLLDRPCAFGWRC